MVQLEAHAERAPFSHIENNYSFNKSRIQATGNGLENPNNWQMERIAKTGSAKGL